MKRKYKTDRDDPRELAIGLLFKEIGTLRIAIKELSCYGGLYGRNRQIMPNIKVRMEIRIGHLLSEIDTIMKKRTVEE